MFIPPSLHPGLADFAVIRRHHGLYVDKTACFRDLLLTMPSMPGVAPVLNNTHLFLVRPRRFGKSLLLSTLEAWFQGLPPKRSARLDPDASTPDGMPLGWTDPDWLWEGLDAADWHGVHGWHPVIRLDMSEVVPEDPSDMRASLQEYLLRHFDIWGFNGVPWGTQDVPAPPKGASPYTLLWHLIAMLDEFYDAPPVVLVDEYDAPLTRYMGTDRDPAPALNELRDLYRVLKNRAESLYGALVTGITRLARPHLFSAANNFTDISEWRDFAAVCGFTEAEVDVCLRPHRQALKALEPAFDEADMLSTWTDMYNGYRFAKSPAAERVYNPFTLIQGLEQTLGNPDARDEALQGEWPSAWSETAHPALTVRIATDTHQPLPPEVRAGGPPPVPGHRSLGSLVQPDFVQLMQDTGYYTWHGGEHGGKPYLNFPNREVASSWLRDILDLWVGRERPTAAALVDDVHNRLAVGDVHGFARGLETFFNGLAHENLINEACFRAVLQTLCRLTSDSGQAEKSVWGGRVDQELTVSDRTYVFEVKYNRTADEALRQIRDRPYGREHLHADRNVTAVGLAFRQDREHGVQLDCRSRDLHALLGERNSDDDNGGGSPTQR